MKVQVLASGSKGNSTIVLGDNVNLIIDMGIPYLTLKRRLEEDLLSFEDFAGILITHNHKDHIKGLKSVIKHTNLSVLIPEAMYDSLKEEVPKSRCTFIDDNFDMIDLHIELIHTSHDAPYSVGFIITEGNKGLVYVTDTGYINRKFLSRMVHKDMYIMESNHDEVMLMDGVYPRFLKERIISDKGHLSNNTTAGYLKKIIGTNTKNIILVHISEKNNTEELALKTMREALKDYNVNIIAAEQEEPSEIIEV